MDQAAYFEQMRTKRRNDILDMAREMILARGVASFTIQQLARDMDISTVTLYKYFKNSEDIMCSLQERTVLLRREQMEPVIKPAKAKDPMKSFLKYFQKAYEQILEKREDVTLLAVLEGYLHRCPQNENMIDAKEYLVFLTGHTFEEFMELLEEAQAAGQISSELNFQEIMEFIADMNMAAMRHIGLLDDEKFEKQKQALKRKLERLLKVYMGQVGFV